MSAVFAGLCPQLGDHEPHLIAATIEWTCLGKLVIPYNIHNIPMIAECGGHKEHDAHKVRSQMDLPCKGTSL